MPVKRFEVGDQLRACERGGGISWQSARNAVLPPGGNPGSAPTRRTDLEDKVGVLKFSSETCANAGRSSGVFRL